MPAMPAVNIRRWPKFLCIKSQGYCPSETRWDWDSCFPCYATMKDTPAAIYHVLAVAALLWMGADRLFSSRASLVFHWHTIVVHRIVTNHQSMVDRLAEVFYRVHLPCPLTVQPGEALPCKCASLGKYISPFLFVRDGSLI